MQPKLARVFAALAREGLEVEGDGSAYTVRLASNPDGIRAEVLLPPGFPLEGAALRQLANLAAVAHPGGGRVARVCATPDFHPGDGRAGIAIGSVLGTEGLVVPAAVGTDINCGMRLHVVDIDVDRFQADKRRFVDLMKGDLFFGRRDVPMAPRSMVGMFRDGIVGWLLELMRGGARGRMRLADLRQLDHDARRVYLDGCLGGDESWAPDGLVDASRDEIRDDGLATVGGGNHFLELQVVDEIVDRALAYQWGLRAGNVAFMIHSGSRKVGVHVGFSWSRKALEAWPAGVPHPDSGIFPLCEAERPDLVASYLAAEATAANYGFVNRLLLAELVRWRLREVFGEIEAPLVYDIPHNITLREGPYHVARKGACPAHAGQPVIIPGSMGAPSYLLVGLGNPRTLSSASHGAGRAVSRFSLTRAGAKVDEEALGLRGVECIALREERRIEEAPAAYKPIQPVIDRQVEAGLVRVVARMRPLLTFKA
jgi:tRNA-splicing ligase RtcB